MPKSNDLDVSQGVPRQALNCPFRLYVYPKHVPGGEVSRKLADVSKHSFCLFKDYIFWSSLSSYAPPFLIPGRNQNLVLNKRHHRSMDCVETRCLLKTQYNDCVMGRGEYAVCNDY